MTHMERPGERTTATRANIEVTTTDTLTVRQLSRHPAVRNALRDAREQERARRARVLAHPDLAARLTHPPVRHSRPEVWSGYVPPARGPYGAKWPDDNGRGHGVDDAINTSPVREALMSILRAVAEREHEREFRHDDTDAPSGHRTPWGGPMVLRARGIRP